MIDPSITDKTEKRYVDSTAQREQQAAAVAAYGPVVAAPPDLYMCASTTWGRAARSRTWSGSSGATTWSACASCPAA